MFDWERGRMFNRLSINVVSRRGSSCLLTSELKKKKKKKKKKTERSRLSEVEIAEFLTKTER